MFALSIIAQKLKESFLSIIPIVVLVLFINFTIVSIGYIELVRFLIGSLLISFGLGIFIFGVELSIDKIGRYMGESVAKSNKIWIVVLLGFILGFFISIAEPDLHILASQVDMVSNGLISKNSILITVSVGIAILLAFGLIRILYKISLKISFLIIYGFIFVLSLFTSEAFISISFDASGATTGALTVPFILSLAFGISKLNKNRKNSERDSFGLVGIVSTGAIIAVMISSIVSRVENIGGSVEESFSTSTSILQPFISSVGHITFESILSLLPIAILFIVFQLFNKNFSFKKNRRIYIGLFYTLLGLVLLLTGVNAGFMEVGSIIGHKISALNNPVLTVSIGFILGLLTILAEPAVFVLIDQIESVTSGYIKRKTILVALSIGVGIAIALSVIRILVPSLRLWHYLLPLYLISIILMFFVPELFVGIAFDSGGVASGPMTITFVLSFARGIADYVESADVLIDGFGVISMVALTPLITIQALGLIYKMKSIKKGVKKSV